METNPGADYSPASAFPGSDSHLELHGPTHGSNHNSNDIQFVSAPTDTLVPVESDPSSF